MKDFKTFCEEKTLNEWFWSNKLQERIKDTIASNGYAQIDQESVRLFIEKHNVPDFYYCVGRILGQDIDDVLSIKDLTKMIKNAGVGPEHIIIYAKNPSIKQPFSLSA